MTQLLARPFDGIEDSGGGLGPAEAPGRMHAKHSIHVSSTPDRRKNSAAAMVNPHIRARAPTTTVTYDDRTLGPFPASPPVSVRYRQGRDRPCAELRWPRTVNRRRRLLAMPSKLLPTLTPLLLLDSTFRAPCPPAWEW